MSIGPTLTIEEILKLFKQYIGVEMQKPALYYYITKKGFPKSTGWGKPRKWLRDPVLRWLKEQNKNITKS